MNSASDHLAIRYGSKEDDNAALKSLSAVSLTENQSKESIVSVILNSLGDLSDVISIIDFLGTFFDFMRIVSFSSLIRFA